ncbi:MAG: substrate-binding domain-containing protein [Chitinophagales bacterium]|nr:substrate-binding domain-containing protein [Hyphomicrobiales bacterium]
MRGRRTFSQISLIAIAAIAYTPTLAVEVTLRSRTGDIAIQGELAASDERTFIIKSDKFGVMMLEVAKFECVGAECPRNKSSEYFSVHGSNTIGAQLMPAIIERYAESTGASVERRVGVDAEEVEITLKGSDGKNVAVVDLQSHGSGTSAPNLATKKAEIGMSSRPIKPEEVKTITDAGMTPKPHVVALDGLVVFVSPENPLKQLTLDQVAKVFSGQITDWAQLGQKPRKINVYARDDKSGTFDTFDSLVLKPLKLKISPTAKRFESSPDLSDETARDPDGIGFGGFAYLRNAKALAISGSCGILSKPSPFSVRTEEYALARRLYLYTTNALSNPKAEAVVKFALSDQAQEAVTSAGFINQSVDFLDFNAQAERLATALAVPDEDFNLPLMRQLVVDLRGARRISTTYRFDRNSFVLDDKAQQDVTRLATFLQTPAMKSKEIMLIGFADSLGPFDANRVVSQNRVNAVRNALVAAGGPGLSGVKMTVKAYGELMPVSCNDTDISRENNRRVEVWVRD